MEKENISTMIEPKAGELDATDIKILTCLQDNSLLYPFYLPIDISASGLDFRDMVV